MEKNTQKSYSAEELWIPALKYSLLEELEKNENLKFVQSFWKV